MVELVRERVLGRKATHGFKKMLVSPGQLVEVRERTRDCGDASRDARAMLRGLNWRPERFSAVCRVDTGWADAAVEFPSPFAHLSNRRGTVSMNWHAARDPMGRLTHGPAVVVLDILQAGNLVSGYIARAFARRGIHGFVLDLPHSTKRGKRLRDCHTLFTGMRQCIADARRARDVIAALPYVDGRVGIQGTSFGGFVASITAALDNAFDVTCLALCGGDLYRIAMEGKVEAAKMRQALSVAGIRDDQAIREFVWQIEPMRLAHRLDPNRTFLWTARRDQVVPASCSQALASAANLPPDHLQQLSGCHYTCALATPWWTSRVVDAAEQLLHTEPSYAIAAEENERYTPQLASA